MFRTCACLMQSVLTLGSIKLKLIPSQPPCIRAMESRGPGTGATRYSRTWKTGLVPCMMLALHLSLGTGRKYWPLCWGLPLQHFCLTYTQVDIYVLTADVSIFILTCYHNLLLLYCIYHISITFAILIIRIFLLNISASSFMMVSVIF